MSGGALVQTVDSASAPSSPNDCTPHSVSYGRWAGYEAWRHAQGDHDWYEMDTTFGEELPGEYYKDQHTVFDWIGFGGDCGYQSGSLAPALTQAGVETLDDGGHGGTGTIQAFSEYVAPDGSCCLPYVVSAATFPIHQWDHVQVRLDFWGDTSGIGDDPKGESKHDSTNFSGAQWDNLTTYQLTSHFFAYGKHFSDTTLDWIFEVSGWPYLSDCYQAPLLQCTWWPVEFDSDSAIRLNSATDQLLNLSTVTDDLALSGDDQHIWACPLSVQPGNWWFTVMGHYSHPCP